MKKHTEARPQRRDHRLPDNGRRLYSSTTEAVGEGSLRQGTGT